MVAARDGVCLLTGRQPPHRLDAAHIVPQSRPDVRSVVFLPEPAAFVPLTLKWSIGLPRTFRRKGERGYGGYVRRLCRSASLAWPTQFIRRSGVVLVPKSEPKVFFWTY